MNAKKIICLFALLWGQIANAQFYNPGNSGYTSLRTPASFGLTIDNTNTTDVTTILNTFIADCINNRCFLPCGTYKTSGELVASGSGSATFNFEGGGPQCTIIAPTNNNFNGIRIALGDNLSPKGSISNIGIIQTTVSLPASPNNKAGFMCDGTTLFEYNNVTVSGFDVAYDFINNCYNFHGYAMHSPRFGTNNVGINLREGTQSGSDMHFYGTYLFPVFHAVVVKGNAGGFHFFGGQWSALDTANCVADANRGVIQLGYDWENQSNGGAVAATSFNGISLEGFHCNWAVNSVQALLGVQFYGFSIVATDNSATKALGIWQATNAGNSSVTWIDGQVGQSFFARAVPFSLSGRFDGFTMFEGPWSSVQGTTLNGVSQGDQWLTSLNLLATAGAGSGSYSMAGQSPVFSIGNGLIRWNFGTSSLQRSNDGGATWTAF